MAYICEMTLLGAVGCSINELSRIDMSKDKLSGCDIGLFLRVGNDATEPLAIDIFNLLC